MPRCASMQLRQAGTPAPNATKRAKSRRSTRSRRLPAPKATCSHSPWMRARQGDGRRDLRRDRKGLQGRHQAEIRSIPASMAGGGKGTEKADEALSDGRCLRGSRWPPPAHSISPRWARTVTTAGQKVVASADADLGFDVDIGPLFQTPGRSRRQAVENDVHIAACLARRRSPDAGPGAEGRAGKLKGAADIMIVVGGVIPPQDFDALYAAGASAIFPPGHGHRRRGD
jgi:methylmalonyl-CoA mutase cobalamin-binding domain/chain